MDEENTRHLRAERRPPDGSFAKVAMVVLGLACGISALFSGFYDVTTWQPILLGLLGLLVAVVVVRPAVPTGPAIVALAGLLALWLWSLLSSTWAEAGDLAVTDANRWLLYSVILALVLVLARDSQTRRLLIAAATAGVLIVASYLLIRFLSGGATDFFVGNRLNGPLDYINGVASYLLLGLWPLVAVAERARHPAVRGLAVFAAVQLVSLSTLTQSRGGILALCVSVILLLAVVPGRLRRAWVLVATGVGVALAIPAIRDVIGTGGLAPSGDALQTFALTSLAGGAAAGLLWALASLLATASRRRSPQAARTLRRVSVAGITVIALAAGAVALFPPGERVDQVQTQYETFTSLQPADTDARLVSGGGNRYDYWRVALRQFEDHPLNGVGAGNYSSTYYLERQTTEDIQQPHSIQLQTLGEVGLVGGLALAAFLGAVVLAFWRTARGTPFRDADPTLAVAAGGTFFVWLLHTSVDWMHLIPGLTGMAICAAAVLLPAARPLRRPTPAAAIALIAVVAGLAAYPVANQLLAQRLQSQAAEKLRSDPVAALRDARDSLELQRAQRTYYLESAAYARLGLYRPARQALLDAADRAPHDFVVWGLLGDLATRRGLTQQAQADYERALRLNPLDPGLAALVAGEDR